MDERRRLKRVPRLLPGHPRSGELAQLRIDEREQFIPGPGITVLNRFKETGGVAHRRADFAEARRA